MGFKIVMQDNSADIIELVKKTKSGRSKPSAYRRRAT